MMSVRRESGKQSKPYGLWFKTQVFLATGLVWSLGRSLRVSWHHESRLSDAREASGKKGVIYAFWHQRLLPFCFTHRRQGVNVLVSTHKDGEIIARLISNLGFRTVRGSSTRGGLRAFFEMASDNRQHFDIAVTPDGPRGPSKVLKPGLLLLARRTGRPVIPIANAVWPRIELRSWDRFHLPAPGARCSVVLGEPWWPTRNEHGSTEDARLDLEVRLKQITDEADELVGATSS